VTPQELAKIKEEYDLREIRRRMGTDQRPWDHVGKLLAEYERLMARVQELEKAAKS
jgi:hypothetical protein